MGARERDQVLPQVQTRVDTMMMMMMMIDRTRHRFRSCQGQTSCVEVVVAAGKGLARPPCLAPSRMSRTREMIRTATGPTRHRSPRGQMVQVGSVEIIGEGGGATRLTPLPGTMRRMTARPTSETLPPSRSSLGQTTRSPSLEPQGLAPQGLAPQGQPQGQLVVVQRVQGQRWKEM